LGWTWNSPGFYPYDLHLPKYLRVYSDEYAIFLVKPNNKSQGQGIFLLKKINQLKKIIPGANLNVAFKGINMN
jgi:hypothetical protein